MWGDIWLTCRNLFGVTCWYPCFWHLWTCPSPIHQILPTPWQHHTLPKAIPSMPSCPRRSPRWPLYPWWVPTCSLWLVSWIVNLDSTTSRNPLGIEANPSPWSQPTYGPCWGGRGPSVRPQCHQLYPSQHCNSMTGQRSGHVHGWPLHSAHHQKRGVHHGSKTAQHRSLTSSHSHALGLAILTSSTCCSKQTSIPQ